MSGAAGGRTRTALVTGGTGQVHRRHRRQYRHRQGDRAGAMERGTVTPTPTAAGNDHYDVLVIGIG